MKIMVINGPNINMLGVREPDVYGKVTYQDLESMIEDYAANLGAEAIVLQSNGEGELSLIHIEMCIRDRLCGEDDEAASANAQKFFDFEKQLSDAALTIAEQKDLEETYNIYSLEELKEIFSTRCV